MTALVSTPEHHVCHVKLLKLVILTYLLLQNLTILTAYLIWQQQKQWQSWASLMQIIVKQLPCRRSRGSAILSWSLIVTYVYALLRLTAVTSWHDVKGLQWLYDAIKANVRGLKVLQVQVESYGSLMVAILMNKMPSEIWLIVSLTLKTDKWDFNDMMQIMEQEVDAREHSFAPTQQTQQPP